MEGCTIKLIVILAALTLFTAGCSTRVAVTPASDGPSVRLEASQKVYIARAEDGRYADTVYSGTGAQISGYVARYLVPYVSDSLVESQAASFEISLQKAREYGAKYLFIPEIKHWEQRSAAWSGTPTRVIIALKVYDGETGERLADTSASARGRIATIVSQHASDLAEHLIADLVKSFY